MLNFIINLGRHDSNILNTITTCCRTRNVKYETVDGTVVCPTCGAKLYSSSISYGNGMGANVWGTEFRLWDNGPDKNVRLTRVGKKYMVISDVSMFIKKSPRTGKFGNIPKRQEAKDIMEAKERMAQAVMDGTYIPKGARVNYVEVKEIISFNPRTGLMYLVQKENNKKVGLSLVKSRLNQCGDTTEFLRKCVEYRKAQYKKNADWVGIEMTIGLQDTSLAVMLLRYPSLSNVVDLRSKNGFGIINMDISRYVKSVLRKHDKGLDIVRKLIPGCSKKLFHLVYTTQAPYIPAARFIAMFGIEKMLENIDMFKKPQGALTTLESFHPYYEKKKQVIKDIESYAEFSKAVGPKHLLNLIKSIKDHIYVRNDYLFGYCLVIRLMYGILGDSVNTFGLIRKRLPEYTPPLTNTLKKLHDKLVETYSKIRHENVEISFEEEELKDIEDEVNGHKFTLLKQTHDFIEVGTNMHHCVGTYTERAINKELWIVVMHKDESDLKTPQLCIELRRNKNGYYRIAQARRKYDARPNDSQKKPLLVWCENKRIDPSWLESGLAEEEEHANARLAEEEGQQELDEYVDDHQELGAYPHQQIRLNAPNDNQGAFPF